MRSTETELPENFLDDLETPVSVQGLSREQLLNLAKLCRRRIIEVTSQVGGHLASSLGTVELTVALYHVFNAEKDAIVWDVGHQGYSHKLLTGRNRGFDKIGRRGGVAKFLRRAESRYDHFGAGHASTSISAALGMASAMRLNGDESNVVAVIGDGALTGGLSFEAMNHAGHLDGNLTVILNDNEMSIDPNVGALSKTFNLIQTSPLYNRFRGDISGLKRKNLFLRFVRSSLKRLDDSFMELLSPAAWFEKLGFRYFGPVDGNDLKSVIEILTRTSRISGPVLIHLTTQKGKGYGFAEGDALKYHGVTPFIPESGVFIKKPVSGKSYTAIWSDAFTEIFRSDEKVTATSAAMIGSVGLKQLQGECPERIFDVGIAEGHAVTFNAGLACRGLKPFVAIYSTFLQRALDHIIHDVALQKLPVRFVLDRAGFVGADGATHHGAFDLTYLRMIPNMVVMAPKDGRELKRMVHTLHAHEEGPVAVRFPRGDAEVYPEAGENAQPLEIGKGEVLREGPDLLICAVGSMVDAALKTADLLKKNNGIRAGVINARFVKPLDGELIAGLAQKSPALATMEENAIKGGFGSGVVEMLAERGIWLPFKQFGLPDEFIEYGTLEEQLEEAGLLPAQMAEKLSLFLRGGGVPAATPLPP